MLHCRPSIRRALLHTGDHNRGCTGQTISGLWQGIRCEGISNQSIFTTGWALAPACSGSKRTFRLLQNDFCRNKSRQTKTSERLQVAIVASNYIERCQGIASWCSWMNGLIYMLW